MKLGIVTTGFSPREHALGISNTVYLISRYLIKHGVDVSIYTTQSKGTPEEEEFDNISIKRFKFTKIIPRVDYNVSLGMPGALKKGGLELIHSFHYAYFPATAGFIAAKSKGVPHIFTTSYHPSQLTTLKTFLMKLYDLTQGQFILRGSYKVFPQNIDELNHLRKIARFDHALVPCPINEDVFYPRKTKGGKITILYVGTMVPWKGAGIAFDICKEIEKEYKNIRFVFIGDGVLRKELMNKAGKRFVFLKNIPTPALAEWFRKADIFLYPTRYESFGRVLAEAQLCGTPAITTKVGGVPETVGNGGLLVDYGDWERMKDHTIKLLSDNQLRKKIGKKAIKNARQFKSQTVANKIYRVYKEALDS